MCPEEPKTTISPEVGKKYITRGGEVVGPVQFNQHLSFPYYGVLEGGNIASWTDTGSYWRNPPVPHEHDLMSEYIEPRALYTGDVYLTPKGTMILVADTCDVTGDPLVIWLNSHDGFGPGTTAHYDIDEDDTYLGTFDEVFLRRKGTVTLDDITGLIKKYNKKTGSDDIYARIWPDGSGALVDGTRTFDDPRVSSHFGPFAPSIADLIAQA